jgi:DNA-binding MarR family transcriptional regulator
MSDVNEELTFELLDAVWRRIRHEMERDGQAIAPDLRGSHKRVLSLTPAEGMRVSELAARTRMTAQSLGQMVDVLRRAGYLEVVPDPGDRRVRLVRPTARGHQAAKAGRHMVRDLENRLAAEAGPAAWRQFRAVLAGLARAPTSPDGTQRRAG